MAAPLRLRKAIRKSIVTLLKDKTDAADRVFPNAAIPTWNEELPAILVYPKDESIEKSSQSPKEHRRVVSMVIEVVAKGPDTRFAEKTGEKSCEDIVDDIIEQVDTELSKDHTLGGVADDHDPSAVAFEFEGGGQNTVGAGVVTYDIMYHKYYPVAETGLDDLETVNIKWHVGHHDEDPDLSVTEAEDDVAVPTE